MTPGDEVRPVVERRAKLGDEAALADSRLADDGDELHRRLALGAEERLEQQRALVLATDERRCASRPRAGRRGCARGSRARPGSARPSPSRLDRVERLEGDRRSRPSACVVSSTSTAPTGAADCRRAAVFTTSPVTMPSPRSGRAPSATTASPVVTAARTAMLEPFVSQLLDRLEDPERRANRALGVVLVRDGRAEDRHDGVADELLHRAAEALDVGLHALVVRAQRCADVLGVGAVRAAREADEVDEEDGDDLPLLARPELGDERLTAGKAEAGSLGVLLAAMRAGHHVRIFAATSTRRRCYACCRPQHGSSLARPPCAKILKRSRVLLRSLRGVGDDRRRAEISKDLQPLGKCQCVAGAIAEADKRVRPERDGSPRLPALRSLGEESRGLVGLTGGLCNERLAVGTTAYLAQVAPDSIRPREPGSRVSPRPAATIVNRRGRLRHAAECSDSGLVFSRGAAPASSIVLRECDERCSCESGKEYLRVADLAGPGQRCLDERRGPRRRARDARAPWPSPRAQRPRSVFRPGPGPTR